MGPPNPLPTIVDNVWTALTGSPTVSMLTKVLSPTGAFTETNGYGSVHPGPAPNRAMLDRLPAWSKDTMGLQTSYGYDLKGNMTSVTDPQNRTGSSTLNADGTVATSVAPSTAVTSYGYTNHQLTSVTPPAVTPPSGSPPAYTYDGFGRLRTSTSAAGMTTTLGYDLADRVKTQTTATPPRPPTTPSAGTEPSVPIRLGSSRHGSVVEVTGGEGGRWSPLRVAGHVPSRVSIPMGGPYGSGLEITG